MPNNVNKLTDSVSRNTILIVLGIVATASVIGASLSDQNGVQIIGFGMLIGTSLLALLKQIDTAAKVEKQADVVAAKVEKVATVTEAATAVGAKAQAELARGVEEIKAETAQIKLVTDATHTLSNSATAGLLKTIATMAQREADEKGTESTKNVAKIAWENYEEHQRQQAVIDSGAPPRLAGSEGPGAPPAPRPGGTTMDEIHKDVKDIADHFKTDDEKR